MAQKGDIGARITLTVMEDGAAKDVSGATTQQIIIKAPSGTTQTFTSSFVTDGTNGQIRYTTTDASELNEVGAWKIQARVAGSGFDHKTQAGHFYVDDNL